MKEPSTKDTWLHGLITYYIIFYTVYAGQSWVSAVPFIKVQLHVKQCSPHPYTVSLPISIGQQAKLCLPRVLAEPWFTFKTSVLFCCFQPLEYWRLESGATRSACDQDAPMRDDLLQKLVEEKLLGATQQISDLSPERLPLRELPPGTTASLYLMFLAYIKVSGEKAASKTTFYNIAKKWWPCLRFRSRSEHAMCVVCQSLKSAIHASTDSCS